MDYDLIIRGGDVIDGTGSPRRCADVAVAGGKVVGVGTDLAGDAHETVDAAGLVVSPGFIDSHTHMESQLFWDPAAGPASWHGCTTVIMGNCGLSLAPVTAEGRDFAAGLMSSVEQIPRSVLDEVVPFDWGSFGEYISSTERQGLGVNAASFVGYSLVRYAAMGERAFEGVATDDDLATIERHLDQALADGALGISYNRATYDHDEQGRLMAGWDADWDEMRRTAALLRKHPGTMLQVIPSWAELSAGWGDRNERELEAWIGILRELDRPMVWSAVSEKEYEPQMDATRRARAAGVQMTAGIHSIPIYTFATFGARGLFASIPVLDFVFELPLRERIVALRDSSVRDRVRAELAGPTFDSYPLKHVADDGTVSLGMSRTFRWDQIYPVGAPPGRFELDQSVATVAQRQGVEPIDLVLDLALANDLRDVFVVFVHGNLPEVTRELLLDPVTVISSNDTGAHLMLMAQTQATHLLDYWSRQAQHLTLEQAVHLLTGRQADVFGLGDRGKLVAGRAADIVLFDAGSVGPQAPELVDDLPAGGGQRYVARALGIERVIVNGETLAVGGEFTGSTAGRFLTPV